MGVEDFLKVEIRTLIQSPSQFSSSLLSSVVLGSIELVLFGSVALVQGADEVVVERHVFSDRELLHQSSEGVRLFG